MTEACVPKPTLHHVMGGSCANASNKCISCAVGVTQIRAKKADRDEANELRTTAVEESEMQEILFSVVTSDLWSGAESTSKKIVLTRSAANARASLLQSAKGKPS